ncbi:MAG: DUF2442 domain-containing protein [Schwartzia sp. (in: firmicutes)]
MYVKGDICYAGGWQDGMKVTAVHPLRGGMMVVTFSTGEKRLFDASALQGAAFASLTDEKIVQDPTLFHGVITWKNGTIDVAPETVYAKSFPYEAEMV